MANRYSKIGLDIAYSPESFKDMAVAPFALRERHDKLLDYQDNLLKELNNIDVQKEGQDYYNQKKAEIEGQVNDLTKKINSVGAGSPNLINEFRNLKRGYEKETSLAGGIGYLADLKKNIDEQQSQYQKFAIAQGQSPETMQKNYQREYDNYFKNFDKDNLGTDKFIRNKFEPTFAPKYMDILDEASRAKPILGYFANEIGTGEIAPVVNQYGEIAFETTTTNTSWKDNDPQLQAANKYFTELLSPESKQMQDLRYQHNIAPDDYSQDLALKKEYLSKMGAALDIMHIREDSKVTKKDVSGFSGGGGRGGKDSKEETPKAGTLVSTPGGLNLTDETSVADLLSGTYIADFEAKEKDPNKSKLITEEEIAKKKAVEMQTYKVKEILSDPNTLNKINTTLQKDGFKDIEAAKQYISESQKMMNEVKALEQEHQKIYHASQGTLNPYQKDAYEAKMQVIQSKLNRLPINNSDQYQREIDDAKKTLDNAFKEAVPVDGLKYSKVYTLGYDKDSTDNNEQINKGINNQGDKLVNILENSGGSFEFDDKVFNRNKNQAEYTKNIEGFKTALKQGDGKYSFGSIVDAGSTGSSQIQIKYEYGTGEDKKTGSFFIDYDNKSTDSSSMDALLTEMKKNLDFREQAIVESVMDNKKLAGLPVDNTDYRRGGISKWQTNKIKEYSKLFNSDQNYNEDFKKVNYMSDEKFPKSEFNIVMNKDGYHEMHRKDPGKDVNFIPVDQWFKRESAKNYNNKSYPIADITKPTTQAEQQLYVNEIRGFAQLSEDNNVIQVDNNSPKYQQLRNDYLTQLSLYKNNFPKQLELTNLFYNEISQKKIGHKSKKRII